MNQTIGVISQHFKVTQREPLTHILGMHVTRDERDSEQLALKINLKAHIDRLWAAPNLTLTHASPIKAVPIRNCLTVAPTAPDNYTSNGDYYRRTLSGFKDLREVSGAALYISIACRPDITFAAHQLTLVASKPRDEHWKAAIELPQYLKATADRELVYPRVPSYSLDTRTDDYHPVITAHCDSDYGTDRATRRSITGYVIFVDGKPVHWSSRRQPITALSSTEAEYIAIAECAKEVLWTRHLL